MNVLAASCDALDRINPHQIAKTVDALRRAERIFCFGNGGGYAHAMHFASDLRKIAKKQAFSFDNLAELTARCNDQGWSYAWQDWRDSYGIGRGDLGFVFSVGGALDGLSANIAGHGYGIVGQDGSYGERIVIPSTSTPVIEGCQSVIAHHLVEQLCV